MDYPTSDTEARLKDGKFTDGDVIASPVVPPSKNSAQYQNMVFDELIGVITAGGLTPSDQSVTQLIDAINNVIASAIANKSDDGHSHSISDVSGLQTALNGKSNNGHGHAISDVTNLQTELDDLTLASQGIEAGRVTANTGAITASSLPAGWSSPTRVSEGVYEIICPSRAISTDEIVIVNRTDYLGYARGWQKDTTTYRFEVGINTASNQTSITKDGDFVFWIYRS